MAIGEDRVQLAKTESTALGGKDEDADIYGAPVPIDPEEDAIESAGSYVQESGVRDENVGYCRDSGNLQFFDQIQSTIVNLTTLFFSPEEVPTGITYFVPAGYQWHVFDEAIIDGELLLDGKLVLE